MGAEAAAGRVTEEEEETVEERGAGVVTMAEGEEEKRESPAPRPECRVPERKAGEERERYKGWECD